MHLVINRRLHSFLADSIHLRSLFLKQFILFTTLALICLYVDLDCMGALKPSLRL